jgi:hypothetical protein
VFLNGVDLDDKVYETCDVNHVIDEFNRLLEGSGRYHSYWQGPRETALYLYGASAEAMKSCIEPFLADYPLCRQSRTERVA